MSKNLTGVGLDDEILKKWLDVKKLNSTLKCMCMRFRQNRKWDVVELEPESDVLKEEGGDVPDANDFKARLAYEQNQWDEYVRKLAADPDTVKFFTWEFYFQTKADKNIKTRVGLIGWVSDNCSSMKAKMCGASALAELEQKLQLTGSSKMLKDVDEMDYMNVAGAVTQDFKN